MNPLLIRKTDCYVLLFDWTRIARTFHLYSLVTWCAISFRLLSCELYVLFRFLYCSVIKFKNKRQMAPFKFSWLYLKDTNDHLINTWASEIANDNNNILCKCCNKKVCIKRGIYAINQHAAGEKHKDLYKIKFSDSQTHLRNTNNSAVTTVNLLKFFV